MCKKERRSDAGEADAAITEDRSSNRRNNGFSLEFRKEAKSAVWNLRPPSSRDDLEEAPRINPGLLFLTPPHLTKVGGPQPANRSVPFGTFDFHACWLRTNSERQQKWLALKLSFRGLRREFCLGRSLGRHFRRRSRRSRRHDHSCLAWAWARPGYGISLDSFLDASCNIRHRRRHLVDHHAMVVSRTRRLFGGSPPREMDGRANRRGLVSRHGARTARLGLGDHNRGCAADRRFGGGWGCGGSDPCASRSSFTRSCRGGSKGSDQLLFL